MVILCERGHTRQLIEYPFINLQDEVIFPSLQTFTVIMILSLLYGESRQSSMGQVTLANDIAVSKTQFLDTFEITKLSSMQDVCHICEPSK